MNSTSNSSMTSELLVQFAVNALEAAAIVERVPATANDVCAAVTRIAAGSSNWVLGPDEYLPQGVMAALRELPEVILQPSDPQLSCASVGITAAFAGVASSGSVCVTIGGPLASAASLLVELHIVLLDATRVIERPSDLFNPACLEGKALRRDFVLITGPSATADMGPLVRGVHGPHRLHILLLE